MLLGPLLTELLVEIVNEGRKTVFRAQFLLDSRDVCEVLDDLEHATPWSEGHNLIWFQPQRQLRLPEDLVHRANALHRESFLPQIVVGLHDDLHHLPGPEVSER